MSLMMPNWSLSIHAHILAETMVGIAQGMRIAARTSAAAAELGVQHQRDHQAEDRLDDDRDDGEAEGVVDRVPPDRIDERAATDGPAGSACAS